MNQRTEWIDALKGFGIFSVTLGHLGCNFVLEKYIYSFHMFLFFFISGFLFGNNQLSLREYTKRKITGILVPFLCWDMVSTIVGLCMGIDWITSLKRMLLFDGQVCWNSPIWFLWILLITQILYAFLKKYLPYCNAICLVISGICWYLFAENKSFLMLHLLPVSMFFYCFGNLYKTFLNKQGDCYQKLRRLEIPMSFLLLLSSIVFGVLLNERISFTGAFFGNISYCIIAGMSGVLFYVTVFRNSSKITIKSMVYMGKNSLIIMAMQYFLFYSYDMVSSRWLHLSIWHGRNTGKALVVTVLSIVIICLLSEWIKRIGKKVRFVNKAARMFGIR